MLLLVQREAVIDGPVQVDGQLREAQERSGCREVLGAVQHHEPPCEPKLTVQPGVQQGSAVDLDPGLQPTELARCRLGLELERRRIRVGAKDIECRGRSGAFRRHPCNEGAVPDHVEAASPAFPMLKFIKGRETGRIEPARGLVDGVEARRRCAHIRAKILDVFCSGVRRHGSESSRGRGCRRRGSIRVTSNPGCSGSRVLFRRRRPPLGPGPAGAAW
ncbi:hypothetical protein AHiyo1_27880 [Arthrobacter sp. Hiyo1]|nr:hypothetical protein AHiyo1_27880 [Arthrobacter sp. Hiyo1]